jgi:hypothetical protein
MDPPRSGVILSPLVLWQFEVRASTAVVCVRVRMRLS